MHSLRSATLNDELTGLLNRRGFMQSATRLLDLALRDRQHVHLIYFRLEPALTEYPVAAHGRDSCARDLLLRRIGNFLRDLFPSYGVYEVLGRLGAAEFAALTPLAEHATCSAIMLRARSPENGLDAAALPLQITTALFDPSQPLAIDELLQKTSRPVVVREPATPVASIGSAPRSDLTLA